MDQLQLQSSMQCTQMWSDDQDHFELNILFSLEETI